MPQPKDGKNRLDSQTQNFMLNFLRKKFINKIKYSRRLPDPDIFGVTISSHVIYFSIFAIFQALVDNSGKPKLLIRSRRTSCNWRENFRLSKKKRFLEQIERSPFIVNYLWAGVNNYVHSIMLVITKIYVSSSLFHFSFVIEAKPTYHDCVNSNICRYFMIVEVARIILIYKLDLLYIFDINIVFLMRYANLFDFWFDKRQWQVWFIGSRWNWYQIGNRLYYIPKVNKFYV